jgi:hypothetical protein
MHAFEKAASVAFPSTAMEITAVRVFWSTETTTGFPGIGVWREAVVPFVAHIERLPRLAVAIRERKESPEPIKQSTTTETDHQLITAHMIG